MRHIVTAFVLLAFAVPYTGHAQPVTSTAPIQAPMMVPVSFADLAAAVQNAVVNISTTQKIEVRQTIRRGVPAMPVPMPQFPPGSPFQDFFEEFFNGPNGIPQQGMDDFDGGPVPRAQSLGSGFIIDAEKGFIVTNNHVIEDADEIKVILHDDTQMDAKVIGRDPETDLALLKVEVKNHKLQSVSWGNSDTMRVGDWILAVGNPFGLGGTVTSGIISARQRNINAGRYDDFIQTDASINRGNSGGPMFNLKGEVIGINAAIFSPSGGSVGIGFAIPSNLAQPVIEQLIKYGETKRGWIGVKIQEVTPEIAESMNLNTVKGALIASVTPDGPAAKGGIKQGDIITRFNGQDIFEIRNLTRIVAETPIGKAVPVTLLRMGKEMQLNITTGQLEKAKADGLLEEETQPKLAEQTPATDVTIPELALQVAQLTPQLRQRFRLDPAATGIVVTHVANTADAAEKGLRAGDMLLEINQHPIRVPTDIQTEIKATKAAGKSSVLLLVSAQNNLRFVAVKLEEKK